MTNKLKKLRKALKYFSILAFLYLLYLNVFVPLSFSIEQIFLVALEVVRICDEKGSTSQLLHQIN